MRMSKSSLPLIIILFAWVVVNVILFSTTGIKIVSDSPRYLEYANGLASGFYVERHNFWYVGYAFYLLIVFKVFGAGVTGAVIGQYCFAFLAVIALYRTAFPLSRSTLSSVITCLLFIAFADISLWNSYILTESLYTSFICFSIFFLVTVHKHKPNAINISMAIVTVVFTFFIKPTGIALLAAVLGTISYEMFRRMAGGMVRVTILFSCAAVLFLLANSMMTTYGIMENYQSGEVIYDVRTYTGDYPVNGLTIDPPSDLYVPGSPQPVVRVLLFMLYCPVYWMKLFSLKVFYLLTHTRPFWSAFHNVYSLLLLLPSYVLVFKAFIDKRVDRQTIFFSVVFLLIHIVSVGVTSEDWDGRFLIPMLPVVFVLSGVAIKGGAQATALAPKP